MMAATGAGVPELEPEETSLLPQRLKAGDAPEPEAAPERHRLEGLLQQTLLR